jgi:hypothetical protein
MNNGPYPASRRQVSFILRPGDDHVVADLQVPPRPDVHWMRVCGQPIAESSGAAISGSQRPAELGHRPTPMQDSEPNASSRRRWWVVGIASVALGVSWIVYSFVPIPRHGEVRLPTASQHVPVERFQSESGKAGNVRNVATVSTCFTPSTWLATELCAIQDGEIRGIEHKITGRSSKYSRPGDPYLMRLSVTFALADAKLSYGHTTLLGTRGGSRSTGNFGGTYQPFEVAEKETFTGRIEPAEERLLYVEGDRKFIAAPQMGLEEFAKANSEGHFLVLILRLDR